MHVITTSMQEHPETFIHELSINFLVGGFNPVEKY